MRVRGPPARTGTARSVSLAPLRLFFLVLLFDLELLIPCSHKIISFNIIPFNVCRMKHVLDYFINMFYTIVCFIFSYLQLLYSMHLVELISFPVIFSEYSRKDGVKEISSG